MKELIQKLEKERTLSKEEIIDFIDNHSEDDKDFLFERAREIRRKYYGNSVFMRGLIEFTNYCKNDCYYCGIRKSNEKAERYRLSKDEILECCKTGYELGFRTFVLQGGEDGYFTDEKLIDIIKAIKDVYPDCAITLSVGEKSYESYKAFYDAGADRYLLRIETTDEEHYKILHPSNLSLSDRKQCLADLKAIGFEVGTGIMVGSPYQTTENIANDLIYISELQPQMVGIGPFIPHHETPLAEYTGNNSELTLIIMGILRLMLPNVLLPSTTALGTADSLGREKGILAGGNVVMPNLSPVSVRNKYLLYDNKICTGDEAAECRECMGKRMNSIGYELVVDRGDCKELV